jgi:hypothetical protein|nr:MAG TPA: NTF2-like Protein [Caudoviricetes sp.]
MLRKVLCSFQFTEGDLIYVENRPALVINAYTTWIKVLMLYDGKIETRNIERERIGNAWNNTHIDYYETVSLTPDMEKLIEFLTGASYLGR